MPRYEIADDESGKFWEITLKGTVVSTRTGKIGAGSSRDRDGHLMIYQRRGRTADREFPDRDAARREYEKLIAAKRGSGWRLVAGIEPDAPVAATLEVHVEPALEAAILDAPDDPAAYLVYADWLQQQGDPRGDLIALQHAMRSQRDPAAFSAFRKREDALRREHERAWLGDAVADSAYRTRLDWRLGFVDGARLEGASHVGEHALAELVAGLLASVAGRFVRRLTLVGDIDELVAATPVPPPRSLRALALHVTSDWYAPSTEVKLAALRGTLSRFPLTVDAKRQDVPAPP